MHIERVRYSNFRCFGPEPLEIQLLPSVVAFVGANGSGKTAALVGLQRMFGTSNEARRVKRTDFHVPSDEAEPASSRTLFVEAVLVFPELLGASVNTRAVPEFFRQMIIADHGQMIVRLRLDATWTNEGSIDGAVTQQLSVVTTTNEDPDEEHLVAVPPHDRARVQVIYIPPAREARQQLTDFLRGRLWRAARWSDSLRDRVVAGGTELNTAFAAEPPVKSLTDALTKRWSELHVAATDSQPEFRAVDREFADVVRRVSLHFSPAASGGGRGADELSEGQQSLLQMAMTAATLDVEAGLETTPKSPAFDTESMDLPSLTVVALEEPENSLAPFYLSRILTQLDSVADSPRAQTLLSSHSASVLRRIDPRGVRYFRPGASGSTSVRSLTLPEGLEAEEKYVREAVKAFPEMYFARVVVLGEGASEQVVIPAVAAAMGVAIDQSFVAVVPLGGRHVHHMWRLLNDLDIPHLTLLDLDSGRSGGGAGRIKTALAELVANDIPVFEAGKDTAAELATFDALLPSADLSPWLSWLSSRGVYFSTPLDLDWSMLRAFPAAYCVLESGMRGPSADGQGAEAAVLGGDGVKGLYDQPDDRDRMSWYRYLFLNRGKPGTHLRALSRLTDDQLKSSAPAELISLVEAIAYHVR